MDINKMIFIAVSVTIVLSVLIYWSIGETRRHNQRQALRRASGKRSSKKRG
jgi:uncharacterized membrane protein